MPTGIWLTLKECKKRYSKDRYKRIKTMRKKLGI